MPYMPTVRCPKCGQDFSAMSSRCPNCGARRTLATDRDFTRPVETPAPPPPVTVEPKPAAAPPHIPGWQQALGVGLIVLGLVSALLCALLLYTQAHPRPTPTPVPTETPAPTPAPTPTITSLRLFHLDRELDEGFTAYVGDAALTLTVAVEPAVRNARVVWSLSDPEAAELEISADTLSCEFTARKPAGKLSLTVRCYGAEYSVPVYLWNR